MLASDLAEATWASAARLRVLFVHQSVGRDLLAGVSAIAAGMSIAWPMRDITQVQPAGAAILHARLGRNRDPVSKLVAFRDAMTGASGRGVDVALVKLCYVDVRTGSDPDALCRQYVEILEDVARAHPATRVAAITVPLTTAETLARVVFARVLSRRTPERDDNAVRARFNASLRDACGRRGLALFDIAAAESTAPDGSPTRFVSDGRPIESLDPAWTSDGGHLNERGRIAVAGQFLQFLADLSRRDAPAQPSMAVGRP